MFVPNFTVMSVADIDLQRLKKNGIRGILLDFDNTLVKWNDTRLRKKVVRWVAAAKRLGFLVCIVSNAITERLQSVADRLQIPFVPQACKPSTLGIRRALEKLSLDSSETLMVGDQLFTDVLAGKRSGLHTALIRPKKFHEQWWMKGVRYLENLIQAKAFAY